MKKLIWHFGCGIACSSEFKFGRDPNDFPGQWTFFLGPFSAWVFIS